MKRQTKNVKTSLWKWLTRLGAKNSRILTCFIPTSRPSSFYNISPSSAQAYTPWTWWTLLNWWRHCSAMQKGSPNTLTQWKLCSANQSTQNWSLLTSTWTLLRSNCYCNQVSTKRKRGNGQNSRKLNRTGKIENYLPGGLCCEETLWSRLGGRRKTLRWFCDLRGNKQNTHKGSTANTPDYRFAIRISK